MNIAELKQIGINDDYIEAWKLKGFNELTEIQADAFSNHSIDKRDNIIIAAQHNVGDTESGFRAYSKKAITTMDLKETGMAVSAEIVTEAARKGLVITEVQISVRYTQNGSTLNPIVHGVGNLNRIMVMISERRPLLFFGLVGVSFIIFGLIAGIGVILSFNTSNILATGWALVTMLMVTVGVLCLFTGVILSVLVKRLGK